MANKSYSKYELQTLLETSEQQIVSLLLNPSGQNLKIFYQNFASTSLKVMKYINHYLNLLNSDQTIGRLIDDLHKKLSDSFREYRIKNFGSIQNDSEAHDHGSEEDQIYHFMNTRNTNLPVECLNNFENDKQRKELQQFVQQMSKHTKILSKQPKRSLILPKQNNFKIKFGRKATFDPDLRFIEEQDVTENAENKISANFETVLSQKTCQNVEIQTDFAIQDDLETTKKSVIEVETEVQCEFIAQSEKPLQIAPIKIVKQVGSKSNNSKKTSNKELKNKKKQHGIKVSNISFKQSMEVLNQHQEDNTQQKKDQKKFQCSLKTVDRSLKINNKQLHFYIFESVLIDQSSLNRQKELQSAQQIENYQDNVQTQTKINDQIQVEQPIISQNNKILIGDTILPPQQLRLPQQTQKSINQIAINIEKNQQVAQKVERRSSKMSKKSIDRLAIQDIVFQQPSLSGYQSPTLNKKSSKFAHQYKKMSASNIRIMQRSFVQEQSNKENYNERHELLRDSIKSIRRVESSQSPKRDAESNHSSYNDLTNIKRIKKSVENAQKISKRANFIQKYDRKESRLRDETQSVAESVSQDYLMSREKVRQLQLFNILKEQALADSPYQSINDFVQENDVISSRKAKIAKIKEKSKNNAFQKWQSKQGLKKEQKKPSILLSISNKLKTFEPHVTYNNQQFNQRFIVRNSKTQVASLEQSERNIDNNLNTKNGIRSIFEEPKGSSIDDSSAQKISSFYKSRNQQCKTVDSGSVSPKRSIFYNKSSEGSPIKTSMSKIRTQLRQLQSLRSHKAFQNKISEEELCQKFQFNDLKQKIRNRANKDKLNQYLQLIQTAHKRFCGNDCPHISQLFKGKQGTVTEQIVRLFKKIKY